MGRSLTPFSMKFLRAFLNQKVIFKGQSLRFVRAVPRSSVYGEGRHVLRSSAYIGIEGVSRVSA